MRKNLAGKKIQCSVSKKHAKRGNEPWLIASSLSPQEFTAKEVIELYRLRMQIEEGFRDTKNRRNGFSLRHCRSYSVERLNVALLINAIAMLLLWCIGLTLKNSNAHYGYQANSIKTQNILSVISIGLQAIARDDIRVHPVNDALDIITNFIVTQEVN